MNSPLILNVPDISASPSADDPWSGDELDRRSVARNFLSIIGPSPMNLCLDAPWGTGKTFFLKRICAQFGMSGGKAIYFNAWEDDFLDDPLVSIIGQLRSNFQGTLYESTISALQKNARPFLEKVGWDFVKQFLRNKAGIDLSSVSDSQLKTENELVCDRYDELVAARNSLQEQLKILGETVERQTSFPLLFVIDELDRCRPTFAIETLERVKHLCSVKGVVFLFGADLNNLKKSISSVYGNIDTDEYLRRFFDFELRFPEVTARNFIVNRWESHGFPKALSSRGMTGGSAFLDAFIVLSDALRLSLRQIETCLRLYALLIFSPKNVFRDSALFSAIVLACKVKGGEYQDFATGALSPAQAIRLLFPNIGPRDYFLESNPRNVLIRYLFSAFYRAKFDKSFNEAVDHLKSSPVSPPKNVMERMPPGFDEVNPDAMREYLQFISSPDQNADRYFSSLREIMSTLNSQLGCISEVRWP